MICRNNLLYEKRYASMIFKVSESLWFDAENLYIIKGKNKFNSYTKSLENSDTIPIKRSSPSEYPTLIFLSSTACNLSCGYCFAHSGSYVVNAKKRFFDYDSYVYVYEETLKQYGGVSGISFFGGEPLLNFDEIKKFVEFLFSHYSDNVPSMSVASNGTIFNNDIKEFLVRYNVGLCTSLDGIKEHNDLSRYGCGINSVYDSVIHTLGELHDVNTIKKVVQMTFNRVHIENYQSGDIVRWLKPLEESNIDWYEFVPVTTDDDTYRINLEDDKIYENFVLMASEYCDYALENIKKGIVKADSNIFAGTILRIIQRQGYDSCSAGFSFCISPDLKCYPCHIFVSDDVEFIRFDSSFRKNIEISPLFNEVKNCNKDTIAECKDCIAKNVCTYLCKGMYLKNLHTPDFERCLFMITILNKIITFMAEEYESNKKNIREVVLGKNERVQVLQ